MNKKSFSISLRSITVPRHMGTKMGQWVPPRPVGRLQLWVASVGIFQKVHTERVGRHAPWAPQGLTLAFTVLLSASLQHTPMA